MGTIFRLTESNFEREVLASEVPVLVEFWASWCPPCKMMEPTLANLADEYNERLRVAKINADQNPHAAKHYTIQGIPTLIVFDAGQDQGRRVGAQSRDQLLELLEETHVLTSLPDEASSPSPESEADEIKPEEEELILEHLRALGYVD
jgi:thioredoxin 1